MGYRLAWLVGLAALHAVAGADTTTQELINLQTRPGVQQPVLVIRPPQPTASVILFAGGGGNIRLQDGAQGPTVRSNNFLVRSRELFAAQGLLVAVVDAPSDKQYVDGMLYGFRTSDRHVTDIDGVIDWLHRQADLPVWLVGTSRGTESATYVALHAHQPVQGLILTSPMSVGNDKGEAVTDMPLADIRLPVQVVVHTRDGCHVTPSYGGERIRDALVNAPAVELLSVSDGDTSNSDACGPMGPHGFLGVEAEVVARIAAFIRAH